jgi:hypothetical protein
MPLVLVMVDMVLTWVFVSFNSLHALSQRLRQQIIVSASFYGKRSWRTR